MSAGEVTSIKISNCNEAKSDVLIQIQCSFYGSFNTQRSVPLIFQHSSMLFLSSKSLLFIFLLISHISAVGKAVFLYACLFISHCCTNIETNSRYCTWINHRIVEYRDWKGLYRSSSSVPSQARNS